MATGRTDLDAQLDPIAPAVLGPAWQNQVQLPLAEAEDSSTLSDKVALRQAAIYNNPLAPLTRVSAITDNIVTEVNLFVQTDSVKSQPVIANPLLDYDSYTYNLSLHASTVLEFNNLVDNPDGYRPKHVLIAGAGRYSDTFPRNTFFKNTDFFFDNFKMTSYINTTTRNKFSNLIECSFTIIEPLGFTLIKRIMMATMNSVAEGGLASANYLKQPFILQIDFFGHKHGEEANSYMAQTLKDHTKFLPLRLTAVKSRVTSKGTEYQFEAVPYNHTAFEPKHVVTPADFSVKAATVQDVFGKGFEVDSSLVDASSREQSLQTQLSQADRLAASGDLRRAQSIRTSVARASISGLNIDAGLTDQINAWNIALQQKTGSFPNKFSVEFDSVIGQSPIESGGLADVSTVAETGTPQDKIQQSGGIKKGIINFSNQSVNIPAGTSIGDVIEWAILNSKWFQTTNIFNDASADSTEGKTKQDQNAAILNAFRIIPRVKVGAYDAGRADYAYEIVFQVKRWLANSKATNAANGRAPGWVKEYNYLYSGGTRSAASGKFTDNKDVIDLQIDFNMLYYTQLTAFKEKQKFQNTGAGIDVKSLSDLTRPNTGRPQTLIPETNVRPKSQGVGPDNVGSTSDTLTNFGVNYVSKNAKYSVLKGSNTAARVAAGDILNTQLIDVAKGDMINIKLTIIGDPTFIKQDDLFYNSGLGAAPTFLTNNNSIRTDDGELYVNLAFKTPDDYDESTGLAIPGQNRFAYTEFSGVYKIITVDSQFTKGKFEQTLDLVKLTTSDQKLNVTKLNTDRIESLLIQGAGQGSRFPVTQTFGPRIIAASLSGGRGGLEGFALGLVNTGINKIITEVSTEVNSALTEIGNSLGDTLTGVFDDITSDFSSFAGDVGDFVQDALVDIGILDAPSIDFDFWN